MVHSLGGGGGNGSGPCYSAVGRLAGLGVTADVIRHSRICYFPAQRLVIDSAAGTGQGLPAWHRSLPGVLGVLRVHRSLPGVPGSSGSRPLEAPLSIPQPGRSPPPWSHRCCLGERVRSPPGDPQCPRAGPRLRRDEVSPPRDGAVVGGPRELAQHCPAGVARAKRGSKEARREGGRAARCCRFGRARLQALGQGPAQCAAAELHLLEPG